MSGKTRTISAYLLRDTIHSHLDAFVDEPEELSSYRVEMANADAALYVSQSAAKAPEWTTLFDGATDPPLQLVRPSFSAVLLLEAKGRLFALTFGGGRFLLRPGSYERNFGLRVALNTVDPEQVRSVQSRTFAETALHVRRQAAHASDILALEMNVQRDLLTTLEGVVLDGEIGKRLSGADAVRLTDEMTIDDLPRICGALLTSSRKTAYKARYPWVDDIEQVTDEREIEQLNEEALTYLLAGEVDRFDVYPAEMVDESVVNYSIDRRTIVMEPTRALLSKLVARISASEPSQLEAELNRLHIVARNEEGIRAGRWTWWDCLYYESRSGESVAVLDRGMWFKVQAPLAQTINDFAASLPRSDLDLPPAKRDEVERAYNERVAVERSDLCLLDRKLVAPIPGESRIEICDLFGEQGHLIHVKRRKGGSSGLSHLFAQAVVSSQLLVGAAQFATAIRSQLAKWGDRIGDPPRSRDHPIVLGVILPSEATGEGARALPFFSKLFLRQNVLHLRAMGFTVYFDEIEAPFR